MSRLESALRRLAEGAFICPIRFAPEFDALSTLDGRERAERWLEAVGYRLCQLPGPAGADGGAFYMAHGQLGPEGRTQVREDMRNLRHKIGPVVHFLETVRLTQQWKDYLGQEIPGRGIKVGHLLRTYRQTMDAVGLRSILAAYYDKHTDKPTLDSLVVPAKTNADAPQASAPTKIKASEYKQNLRDFTSKKMLKADWEAFRARWDQAISTGNVEMDVEIR